MPTTPLTTRTYTDLPVLFPERMQTYAVRLPGGVNYPMGTPLGYRASLAKQNEVQTITIVGTGSFKIGTLDDGYTAAIPIAGLNATVIQTALDNLLGTGQVVVSGSGPYVLTMAGEWAYMDIAMFLLDTALNAGGPTTIAQTTRGSAGPGVTAELADGSTVTAKGLLTRDTKTSARGTILNEFGDFLDYAVPMLTVGDVEAKYIVGLDATIAGQLGRIAVGAAVTDVGAVIRVGV